MRVLRLVLTLCGLVAGIQASAVNTQHEPISHHVTSRMFRSLTAQTDFMSFVSPACQDSTQALVQDTRVQVANATIVHKGCFEIELGNPDVCTIDYKTLTFDCDCEPILSNTAWFLGNVTALGGKVCSASLNVNVVASGNKNGRSFIIHEHIKGTDQQYVVFGNKCTDQDIQTALEASVDQGVSELGSLVGTAATIEQYDLQAAACDFSARRTGPNTAVKPSA